MIGFKEAASEYAVLLSEGNKLAKEVQTLASANGRLEVEVATLKTALDKAKAKAKKK